MRTCAVCKAHLPSRYFSTDTICTDCAQKKGGLLPGGTGVFTLQAGTWLAILDGTMINADFNSPGAAQAGIDVERRRREHRQLMADADAHSD